MRSGIAALCPISYCASVVKAMIRFTSHNLTTLIWLEDSVSMEQLWFGASLTHHNRDFPNLQSEKQEILSIINA